MSVYQSAVHARHRSPPGEPDDAGAPSHFVGCDDEHISDEKQSGKVSRNLAPNNSAFGM